MPCRELLPFFVGGPHHAKLALGKFLIQIYRIVCTVIVLKLLVRHCPAVADAHRLALVQRAHCRAVNDRLQPHLCKISDRFADHSLKSELITDIYGALDRKILAAKDKPDPVALRISICHRRDLFF